MIRSSLTWYFLAVLNFGIMVNEYRNGRNHQADAYFVTMYVCIATASICRALERK